MDTTRIDAKPRGLIQRLSLIIFASVGITLLAEAQTGLPPQVQADLLQNQIVAAFKASEFQSVLDKITQYKKLPVTVPASVLIEEAKAANATHDPLRAWNALQATLQVAKRGTPEYQEALALYPEYEKTAAPARQAQEKLGQQSFSAAEKGDVTVLAGLPPASLDAKDPDGWTPLAFAAAAGQTEAVKFLLSKGVSINAQNNKGMTPLMLAVVGKHADMVSALRTASADVGIRNAAGASAYELALKTGDDNVIAAITTGMSQFDYLTNLADLAPDRVPGKTMDDDERERLKLVNPKGYDRNGVLRMLLESRFISVKEYDELPDNADSLSELEKIMRRYAQKKGVDYEQVTTGRLLTLLQADFNKAYDDLWARIRAGTGPLAGQAGLYMGAMPMNFCGPNNVNFFVWGEGDTIVLAQDPIEERWDRMLIVKRGGEVRTTLSSHDGKTSQKITQTQYFVNDPNDNDGKGGPSWVKIGDEYLGMAVDGPVWHRCKQ